MTPAAVVFDLFGTILDIGSLRTAAARVSPSPEAFVEAWRDKQVAYMFAAASMGCYEDFDRLTRYALQIVFVSSNGWDATGAREFGLSVVWCNRSGLPAETFGRPPNATITSLAELPETITALSD